MPRLITVVDEVVANAKPPQPFDWFRAFDGAQPLGQDDRCLLFLGMDAGRTSDNSVDRMVEWFSDFSTSLKVVDMSHFAAMVFVLDWPRDEEGRTPALGNESDIDKLVEAGFCYRPKEKKHYASDDRSLAESLRADLEEKGLISNRKVVEFEKTAVAPKKLPDPHDPVFQETLKFMGSDHFVWPDETIDELLRR
jgi:hypothetical protein